MKIIIALAISFAIFSYGQAYSKYGRSCKDIGCRSTEVCVMESDPCTFSSRDCGSYPTCKKTTSNKQTCSTYVCPPTKVCKMDGETPKCVDDHSGKSSHVGYNTQATGSNQAQPSSGQSGGENGASLYPSLPNGQNQPAGQRPAAYPGYPGYQQPAGGYQQPAGGYQQPAGGYQQPAGGYQQPGYQNRGQYPGYYPGYQGGYQQGGYYPQYPQYPQGNYGGGQNYPQGNYGGGQKSGSNPISDALTDSLKNIGTDLLKNAFNKLLQGNFGGKPNAPSTK